MGAVAQQLDDKDVSAVAAYYARLYAPGAASAVPDMPAIDKAATSAAPAKTPVSIPAEAMP